MPKASCTVDFLSALTAIGVLLLAACAPGADSPTDPRDEEDPDDTPVALTPERRVETITTIHDKIAALAGSDADSRRAELLTYLRGRPEFEASGVNDDGSLWARFTDERLLLFVIVPDSVAPPAVGREHAFAGTASAGPVAAAAAQSAAPGPPNEVPVSNQARVLGGGEPPTSSFVSGFMPLLKGMLTAGGYQLAANAGTGEIADLLKVDGDGFFYFGGHGGWGWTRDLDKVYGVTTATRLSVANDLAYRNLWLDTSLVYTVEITSGLRPYPSQVGPPCSACYYAFTQHFVRKHMGKFSDHSVVYLGACTSAEAGFRQAFIDQGAGVYFGWTNVFWGPVDSEATQYLVDRMLGLNDPGQAPENPPQRAFDYVSVHKDLAAIGLTRSVTKYGPAVLDYFPKTNRSGLLAPSIETMFVLEDSSLLILSGKFGSRQGEVTINGSSTTALQIKEWKADTIRVVIPVSGSYSAGDVVVWSKGRKSNTRRLSEWRPTFRLQFIEGHGTLKWEGEVRLHFRADVASFRKEAGQTPEYRKAFFQIARDSEGELVGSGDNGAPGANKVTWSDTAKITNRIANPFAPNLVEAMGEFDTESPALRLFLFVNAPEGMKVTSDGQTFPLPAVWAYADGFLNNQNPLPALYIDVDRQFEVLGDSRRQAPTNPSSFLFWSNVTPRYAPDDRLAR